MKKKIGDLTLKEIEYIKTKQCTDVYGSCKNCPIDSIDYCDFDFNFDLDQEIEVEETENSICATCRLNNYCPMNHEPSLQCPYNDYEKR